MGGGGGGGGGGGTSLTRGLAYINHYMEMVSLSVWHKELFLFIKSIHKTCMIAELQHKPQTSSLMQQHNVLSAADLQALQDTYDEHVLNYYCKCDELKFAFKLIKAHI